MALGDIVNELNKPENKIKDEYYNYQLKKIKYLKQKMIKKFLNNQCKLIYKELYYIHKKQQYYSQQQQKLMKQAANHVRYLQNKGSTTLINNELSYIHRYLDIKEELTKCNYQCEICHKDINEKTAKMDHIHGSTKFRGLLCNGCNTRLGLFGQSNAAFDNNRWIKSAIVYLHKHGGDIPEVYVDYLRILKELLIKNNYECEICHEHIDGNTCHIDNFQNSKNFKGLLCNSCYGKLGSFKIFAIHYRHAVQDREWVEQYHTFHNEGWVRSVILHLTKYSMNAKSVLIFFKDEGWEF